MVSKLLPPGFENRLSSLGLGSGLPLEYLGTQELQRLLAQQGLSDQFREAQLQRLQQEALLRSNEELIQTRGGNYQGKNNEIKLEEKDEVRIKWLYEALSLEGPTKRWKCEE